MAAIPVRMPLAALSLALAAGVAPGLAADLGRNAGGPVAVPSLVDFVRDWNAGIYAPGSEIGTAAVAGAGRPGTRDPFAPTPHLHSAALSGVKGYAFQPSHVSGQLPKLHLRGIVHGSSKGQAGDDMVALLEIEGSGVHVVRRGDAIGLHGLGSDGVLKVREIDALSLLVEVGSLNQVMIVR